MNKKLRGDTIPGLIVTIFGLFFLIDTAIDPRLTFAATTADGTPGAGFLPYILSVLCVAAGVALTVRGLRQNGTVTYFEINPERRRNLIMAAKVVVGIVVFFIGWMSMRYALDEYAFYLWAAILIFYLCIIFERSWKFALIYTVVFMLLIYFAFGRFFGIRF